MADISKVRMLNGTEYNYKDAKARSDIEGLMADLGDIIGGDDVTESLTFTTGKYINTGGSGVNVGDTIDVSSPSTYATLKYAIAGCSEGDRFLLNVKGAASGRAWAFLTSSNVLISRADASVTLTDFYITAPENAAKVVINDNFEQGTTGGTAHKVIAGAGKGAVVRFDISQDLTDAEKAQARANIGVSSSGMTDAIKEKLLACFKHVAWLDAPGEAAYNDLQDALYGDSEPVKTYYTKWSTSPPDDTYGKLYVRSRIAILEDYGSNPSKQPTVGYDDNRSAIFTDQDHSDYRISAGSYEGNDVFGIELPPRTTGFTATFGNSGGTCLYVFKKNENGYYILVDQYVQWYTNTEVITGLDPDSEYVIGGGSKVTSGMSVTITTTQA